MLVDAAFFVAQDGLAPALDAAARAGAKGTWFSGSDRTGKTSSLGGGKRRVTKSDASAVKAWILEAWAVAARNAGPPRPVHPRFLAKKTAPSPRSAPKKKSKAAPAKKKRR